MSVLSLPRSVRASLWLPTVVDARSAARAARALDDDGAVSHAVRLAVPHRPFDPLGADLSPDLATPTALPDLLLGLAGAVEHAAVLPRPGDPMGVPPAWSPAVLEAGEGLLVRRADGARCAVLVPLTQTFGSAWEQGTLVTWSVDLDVTTPVPELLLGSVGSLTQARRDIAHALAEAIDVLTELDVARQRPEIAEVLIDIVEGSLPDDELPPGLERRQLEVLERAARVLAIVDLALEEPGASVTHVQEDRRAAALRGVERAARHAMAAASATRAG